MSHQMFSLRAARDQARSGGLLDKHPKQVKDLTRYSFPLGALLLTLPSTAAFAQNSGAAANVTWPEATAQIAKLRTTAETCVSIIKQYGPSAQKAQARIDYGNAKSNADGIITGLTTALFTTGDTGGLPSLKQDLSVVSSDLSKLCDSATGLLPPSSGHKGILDEIVKAALDPLIKAVSDGVSALYNNHRADKELIKKTIQSQLEAAKWQEFDKIEPGH